MLRFRIFFETGDHTDHIDVEGAEIEDIQQRAIAEVGRRNPDRYWSQQIEDAYGSLDRR
jgi:hypothetical protein